MHYRLLGESKIPASVIAHGTWSLGGWMWGGTDEEKSIRSIRASVDAGTNFIDTAPIYGLGLAERIVGNAIRGYRESVVLSTKCGLVWNADRGRYFGDELGTPIHSYLGPVSIRRELERSLRRLQTDYIDLYQTHWQDSTTPIEETMQELVDLKREGKILAIGVSNCTIEQLQRYQSVGQVDAVQERYNVLDRRFEDDLIPYCRAHGIAVLAYSPLANGLLAGNLNPDRFFRMTDSRDADPYFSRESRVAMREKLYSLRPLADKYQLTLAQLVIAWTVAQPGVTHALVGARDDLQALGNAAAGRSVLATADLKKISATFQDPALAWAS